MSILQALSVREVLSQTKRGLPWFVLAVVVLPLLLVLGPYAVQGWGAQQFRPMAVEAPSSRDRELLRLAQAEVAMARAEAEQAKSALASVAADLDKKLMGSASTPASTEKVDKDGAALEALRSAYLHVENAKAELDNRMAAREREIEALRQRELQGAHFRDMLASEHGTHSAGKVILTDEDTDKKVEGMTPNQQAVFDLSVQWVSVLFWLLVGLFVVSFLTCLVVGLIRANNRRKNEERPCPAAGYAKLSFLTLLGLLLVCLVFVGIMDQVTFSRVLDMIAEKGGVILDLLK